MRSAQTRSLAATRARQENDGSRDLARGRRCDKRKTTDMAFTVAFGVRFALKTVADTFEVTRSNLIDRIDGKARTRQLCKSDDELLMPAI